MLVLVLVSHGDDAVVLREPRPVQCLVILRFKLRPVNVPFPLFVFVFLTMKDSGRHAAHGATAAELELPVVLNV